MGTQSRFSARTANTFNLWAIFQTLVFFVCLLVFLFVLLSVKTIGSDFHLTTKWLYFNLQQQETKVHFNKQGRGTPTLSSGSRSALLQAGCFALFSRLLPRLFKQWWTRTSSARCRLTSTTGPLQMKSHWPWPSLSIETLRPHLPGPRLVMFSSPSKTGLQCKSKGGVGGMVVTT